MGAMTIRQTRRGLMWAGGLGLGIGLMIGAAVLAAVPNGPPTDDEVRTRARLIGMVDATQLPQATAPTTPPATKPATAMKVAVVGIAAGSDWTQAAALLKAAGAIADEAAFIARVRERGLMVNLRAGVFEIPLGDGTTPPKLDDVIDALTRRS